MSSINISEKQSATSRRHWNLSHICLGRHKREEAGGTGFFAAFQWRDLFCSFIFATVGCGCSWWSCCFGRENVPFTCSQTQVWRNIVVIIIHETKFILMMWLRSRVLGQAYLAARQAAALAAALAAQPPVQQQAPPPMPQIPLPIRTRLGGG